MLFKRGRRLIRAGSRSAFTLVELMVVIVLIGLLAGGVTLGVRGYMTTGKQQVARVQIAKICQALDTFYTAYDRYPTSDEGLESLVKPSEKFSEGLLSKLALDPWSHRYEYIQPGRSGPYEVMCYGADGREGGEGANQDISSADVDKEAKVQ
jgi:general secretion pathway protein G